MKWAVKFSGVSSERSIYGIESCEDGELSILCAECDKEFENLFEIEAIKNQIAKLQKRLSGLKRERKKCGCPNGSLCEFFNKETETCLYGDI